MALRPISDYLKQLQIDMTQWEFDDDEPDDQLVDYGTKKMTVDQKLVQAGYEKMHLRQTFATTDLTEGITQERITKLEEYVPGQIKWLLLAGNRGTGKDHLASCIGRRWLEIDPKATILAHNMQTIALYYKELAFGKRNLGEWGALKEIVKSDLLILREVGVKVPNDFEMPVICNILDMKYSAELPVIFTSNLDKKADYNKHLDPRIMERFNQRKFFENDDAEERGDGVWRFMGQSLRGKYAK